MNDDSSAEKRVKNDSIQAVLRRRFKSLRDDGYNIEFRNVFERAADLIESQEQRIAELETLAPTAWIEVSSGEIVDSGFYAPGLSDGTHEMYSVGDCTAPPPPESPFVRSCYVMSERHLSGYRLIVGFETLDGVQDAHKHIADMKILASAEPEADAALAEYERGGIEKTAPQCIWRSGCVAKDRCTDAGRCTGSDPEQREADLIAHSDAVETPATRDDVRCECVSNFGPNPDCGMCGGDGCITVSEATSR